MLCWRSPRSLAPPPHPPPPTHPDDHTPPTQHHVPVCGQRFPAPAPVRCRLESGGGGLTHPGPASRSGNFDGFRAPLHSPQPVVAPPPPPPCCAGGRVVRGGPEQGARQQ